MNKKALITLCMLELYISTVDSSGLSGYTVEYRKCLRDLISELYSPFFCGKYHAKAPFNLDVRTKIKGLFFENLGFKFLLENDHTVYFFKDDEITDEPL